MNTVTIWVTPRNNPIEPNLFAVKVTYDTWLNDGHQGKWHPDYDGALADQDHLTADDSTILTEVEKLFDGYGWELDSGWRRIGVRWAAAAHIRETNRINRDHYICEFQENK